MIKVVLEYSDENFNKLLAAAHANSISIGGLFKRRSQNPLNSFDMAIVLTEGDMKDDIDNENIEILVDPTNPPINEATPPPASLGEEIQPIETLKPKTKRKKKKRKAKAKVKVNG